MPDHAAGPPLLRRMNAQAVLDALLAAPGPVDATTLMDATGLSRPTVHAVCEALVAHGLAAEPAAADPPPGPARRGRRARGYALRAGAAPVVGVDMGAGSVRAAVADLRGAVVGEACTTLPDPTLRASDRLAAVRATAARALTAAGVEPAAVRGAALAVPAPVDPAGRAVADDGYLPGLAAADLRGALAPLLPVAPVVDNDANLAVLAERWLGAAAGAADIVLVLAGERLGAGICAGGRLVRGRAGGAGEMGFLDLVAGVGDPTGIGALARAGGARAIADGRAGALLGARTGGDPGRVRAEDVVAAAADGDPVAAALLGEVTERVARALAVLAGVLDPEVLVVGGAVAAAGEALRAPLAQALDRALDGVLPAGTAARPRLAVSPLAGRGPLLGAVRAALDDLRPRLLDRNPPAAVT